LFKERLDAKNKQHLLCAVKCNDMSGYTTSLLS